MRLLNFSIGEIRTVSINGEAVRTAHVKSPVPEPWIVTPDGARGDMRSVHPDKLYAFARTAYSYWGEQLAVDPTTWPDGFFGENLTLDELDERDVRIGDVFALGEEVQLVVSGARTPCVKLAWRLGQPRSFQSVFAKSRHTGAYFGVRIPGIVRSNDGLRRIHHDPTMPSIADVCDYVQSHRPPPLEPLKRLLAYEGLSPTLRFLLAAKLEAASRDASASEGRWYGWRPFEVAAIRSETADVKSLELRAVDGQPLCRTRAGQFVSVRLPVEDNRAIVRVWSLSAFSHEPTGYRLTVKRQTGAGSAWMHEARVGDRVQLRAPTGGFCIDSGGARPVVLIAAGIGITPLHAMLQAHATRPDAPLLRLFYTVRTPADIVFRDELDAIIAQHSNVSVRYVYSGHTGRITPAFVIDALRDLHVTFNGRRIELPWYETDTYICGPREFCAGFKDAFVQGGANPDHVFVESFDAPPAVKPELDHATINFRRSSVTATWHSTDDLSLLEVAEQAGVHVPNDCRAGACMTCKTKLLEGQTTADVERCALLCIARPTSASVILEL